MRERDTWPKRRDGKAKDGSPKLSDGDDESGFQYWFFMIVPLLIAPALMGCCVLSFLERYSAEIGIAVGIIVCISAAMVVFWIAHKHNVTDDGHGMPIAAIAGGMTGVLLYYQFIIVGKRKEAALWFLIELGGLATAVICSIGLNTARPPVLFGLVKQPNDPMAMQKPFGPMPKAGPQQQQPPQQLNEPPPPRVTGEAWLDQALADLQSPIAHRRRNAMTTLGNAPINQNQAVVARKLSDALANNPPEKGALAILLGRWGSANDLPTLHQCLVDPNPQVRRDTLAAIARFQDARSLEPVLRCLHDPATRSEAEKALRQLGPIAEPAVLPLLSQKDAQLRGSALRVLGDVGTQQSVPAVRAAMQTDMDAIVRAIAEDTLRAITARGKR